MAGNKYVIINKDIILEGHTFDFDVYFPSECKKKMLHYKEKGVTVTFGEQKAIEDREALYISENDITKYKVFYKNYLALLEKPDTKSEIENIEENPEEKLNTKKEAYSFEAKSVKLYNKAENIINRLYENPDILSNYSSSKEVVSELVTTVLGDDYAIKSLMNVATNDFYTHTHSLNVAIYAISLGSFIDLSRDSLLDLGEAALLHDLGQSKIDKNIIYKKGILTDREYRIMQEHPKLGYFLGIKLGITNRDILNGIKYHHEKIDGTGYPNGLTGTDIPLFARIITICDIFDALTSKKSYKGALATFDALKLMKVSMKNHVDIKLLNKMILMFR